MDLFVCFIHLNFHFSLRETNPVYRHILHIFGWKVNMQKIRMSFFFKILKKKRIKLKHIELLLQSKHFE